MTASERIQNLIKGKPIDRLPVIEWAPWWNLTIERWNSEGMNIEVKRYPQDYHKIQRYFGLDACVQTSFHVRGPGAPVATHHGAGIIKNRADYEKVKPFLYQDPAQYCVKEHVEWLEKTRADGDTVHFFTVEGFFWMPRELFGIETHLYSFYDEPELLKDICRDYAEWLKKIIEFVGNTFPFDFMSFAEDMSYNNGPMLGEDAFNEYLAPHYREIIPLIKRLDIPVFIDSDGDISKAVDWYAGVGADGMFPLERQAGVDVGSYIDKQPQMTFLGHFDKMCMKFGEKAMRDEFERLLVSAQKGKLIISIDHQTPPDVSLDNYKTYVRLFKQYAGKIIK